MFNNLNSTTVRLYLLIRTIFDCIVALIGIILTLPVLIIFSLLIKLESRGPIFYTQERVGLEGKRFYIIKLRSMYINAELNGAQWASENDPRITKIGLFIRKTRIDELPQLINILKGDMSLIGPRPERPIFTKKFNNEIPGFVNRLAVKPGVTGWAQVNGGYNITPKEKLELDINYINNLSWRLDIYILFKTVKVVLTGDGAR
ncbi:sugar transferase [Priestia filamentosa]|uniref:sugar transferase n=1 Tax=Priestia filamentosa TaxID=1402861 RepID=UPI003F5CCB8A